MFLSCGSAYALPQDWPCKAFTLERYVEIKDDDINTYRGQDSDYALKVSIFWQTDAESDDCGTAGCDGTIKNVKTGQEENLRFFCKAEDNYNVAKCNIRTGEEYILQKMNDDHYQVNLCGNSFFKYVSIDECSECFCILHDSRKKNGDSDFYMGCKQDKEQLHCMTGNIYEEKYYPKSNVNDFQKCVGLSIK